MSGLPLCADVELMLGQRIIFELIKGEMDYVKDLENIEVVRMNLRYTATNADVPGS